MHTAMIAAFTGSEFIWIAVVVLVLFGAKKVPELMKGVGQGIKEFKKATRDVQDEVHRALEETDLSSQSPPKSYRPEPSISRDSVSRDSVPRSESESSTAKSSKSSKSSKSTSSSADISGDGEDPHTPASTAPSTPTSAGEGARKDS